MDSDSATEVAMLAKKIAEIEARHDAEMKELSEVVQLLQELLGQQVDEAVQNRKKWTKGEDKRERLRLQGEVWMRNTMIEIRDDKLSRFDIVLERIRGVVNTLQTQLP